MKIYTFQDFEKATDTAGFITAAIEKHKSSEEYKVAATADLYDKQRNKTVNDYARIIYSMGGAPLEDFTAANNRIASNFFARLNMQRVQYSLGLGISFLQQDEVSVSEDETKEAMGEGFDHIITEAAYHALIHGVSFVFWNLDHCHMFKLTEFVPLWDEYTGKLRAGIRFWRLSKSKPLQVTFYREDGYSTWSADDSGILKPVDEDRNEIDAELLLPYKRTVAYTPADDTSEVISGENYGELPIVPMWANRLKQSTLVGMRAAIDAYDLVKSGFADDMQDCAQVWWIVRNAGGMTDDDLLEFRDRLKLMKIASVDSTDGAGAEPFVQEPPYQARQAFLSEIRSGLYEDFGALDVHTVAAGATNDHIDAAYQPMDENASDLEYWVGSCIKRLLALAGIEDEPIFTRQRISNQKEQVEMVIQESPWLDNATVLRKLPNVRPDEVMSIIQAMQGEEMARMMGIGAAASESPIDGEE